MIQSTEVKALKNENWFLYVILQGFFFGKTIINFKIQITIIFYNFRIIYLTDVFIIDLTNFLPFTTVTFSCG